MPAHSEASLITAGAGIATLDLLEASDWVLSLLPSVSYWPWVTLVSVFSSSMMKWDGMLVVNDRVGPLLSSAAFWARAGMSLGEAVRELSPNVGGVKVPLVCFLSFPWSFRVATLSSVISEFLDIRWSIAHGWRASGIWRGGGQSPLVLTY